jgi:hypothetical protein
MTDEGQKKSLVKPTARSVPDRIRLFLFVHAGGRCEFDDCNHYLLEHHVTKDPGNFAEMAHIWAFSDGGPRPRGAGDGSDVHDLSNLMLLCPACHKLVDQKPSDYPVERLRSLKRAHEERIFMLTDTKPDRKTVAVVVRARIADQPVVIPTTAVQAAVAPRYVNPREVVDVDLTMLEDKDSAEFWRSGCDAVTKKIEKLQDLRGCDAIVHLSVLALAPIPLLVHLGSCLSSKVPTQLFQYHRDTESWKWKGTGSPVEYETRVLQNGSDASKVALLLSLSGPVEPRELPAAVDSKYSVYEITLNGRKPDPRFLDVEESLHCFRDAYMALLRQVVAKHEGLTEMDLFPAIPAPVAVCLGRDLLPKRDPALVVWDYDRRAKEHGWVRTVVVSRR